MSTPRLGHFWEFLAGIQPAMAIFWLGLAIFTVALGVLLYTRWGQYRPLRKCMAMSLLAHLILACYAATIQIVMPAMPPAQPIIHLSLGDGPAEKGVGGAGAALAADPRSQPWETTASDAAGPAKIELERGKADMPAEPKRAARADDSRLPGDLPLGAVAATDAKPAFKRAPLPKSPPSGGPLATIQMPPAQHRDAAPPMALMAAALPRQPEDDLPGRPVRGSFDDLPLALLDQPVSLPQTADSSGDGSASLLASPQNPVKVKPFGRMAENGAGLDGGAGEATGGDRQSVPDPYRLRIAPDRPGVAQSHGGTAETEAAVKAALKWLADNQSANGRWDAAAYGGGRETNVAGRDRLGAGGTADSAVTGLALLAFLASGHTHAAGPYRDDVRRGLEYLMQIQSPDGNLGGRAATFEFMYCHAMAACALSEAYGMTHDPRLREPVLRAIGYTVQAQDHVGGGWRYKPGDAGDTSQLGWQLMSLKSAELAGIPIPQGTRQGVIRYLQSVSSGKYGGRASYRPGEQTSRSMTAESLFCWQLLGLSRQHPAASEAADYLLEEMPAEGAYNLYYWYYATLSMYQLQDAHWQQWNESLRTAILARQMKQPGPLAGSWDTGDLWGSYGGRVFTTALATLTLEVYYRFLPLYVEVASTDQRVK